MKSLIDYFLNEEYAKVERLGDRLAQIDPLINCNDRGEGWCEDDLHGIRL
ncbi:MAG: hypothetical protein ACXQTO_04240 [Candidatus Syntropharchaeales archaeon]